MARQPLFLFVIGFAALQLAFWGAVIRINGPQGLVHGLGDLGRLGAKQRRAIGRCSGNSLLGMAALIAAFGITAYLCAGNGPAIIAAGAILIAAIALIAARMKRKLSRLAGSAAEAARGY